MKKDLGRTDKSRKHSRKEKMIKIEIGRDLFP